MTRDGSWRLIRAVSRRKGLKPVLLVERMQGGRRQFGYFKFRCRDPRQPAGPMFASELISYHLGRALGLPMAEVQVARVGKLTGVVSVVKPVRGRRTWVRLGRGVQSSIPRYFLRPERFLQTFVFDVWLHNIDRNGENIIVYRRGPKLDFYLIDHGLALLSAAQHRRVPWNSPYWNDLNRFHPHFPISILTYVRQHRQLVPYIRRVQRLPAATVNMAVQSVPPEFLSPAQRAVLRFILLQRQRNLPAIIHRWAWNRNRA